MTKQGASLQERIVGGWGWDWAWAWAWGMATATWT